MDKLELGSFRHFVLFSKYHYGGWSDENLIPQLKKIHIFTTGITEEYSSKLDILMILTKLLLSFKEEKYHKKILKDLFDFKYRFNSRTNTSNIEGTIKFMIIELCNSSIKTEQGNTIEIGEIDEELKKELEKVK